MRGLLLCYFSQKQPMASSPGTARNPRSNVHTHRLRLHTILLIPLLLEVHLETARTTGTPAYVLKRVSLFFTTSKIL